LAKQSRYSERDSARNLEREFEEEPGCCPTRTPCGFSGKKEIEELSRG